MDAAVVVLGALDPAGRESRRGAEPELPSARSVELRGLIGRAESRHVVRAASDALQGRHQGATVSPTAPVRTHRHALHVARAQGPAPVQ